MQEQPGSVFATTMWTTVLNAPHDRSCLTQLLETYRDPIIAYLAEKLGNTDKAEDAAHEFITKFMLEGDLLKKADRTRGRFRAYLRTALDHFLIDKYRKEHGRSGNRPAMLPLPDPPNSIGDQSANNAPASGYDRAWATTVMSVVRQRLEAECRGNGLALHWEAYEARILRPLLFGVEPASVESLAQSMKLTGPQISHMIGTVRRKSVQVLRQVVAETILVTHLDELDDEINTLWRCLARP